MKHSKIGLILVIIASVIGIIFLPTCPGNFYDPSHYYNLYLPDFGVNSDISVLPNAFRTLQTMYTLDKMMLVVAQDNPLLFHQIYHVISPLFNFFAFILFFSAIKEYKKYRIFLGGLFSLCIGWNSLALLLGMTVLFFIIFPKRIESKIAMILVFATISLYWHSAHMIFFISSIFLLLGFILSPRISSEKRVPSHEYLGNTLILLTVISIAVWIYIREIPLISNLLKISYYLDPSTIYRGLFLKGSFVNPQYAYNFVSFVPEIVIDCTRYLLYLLVILSAIFVTVKIFLNRNGEMHEIIGVSFLGGTVVFLFLYYVATESFGPGPIILLLLPWLLGYVICRYRFYKKKRVKRDIIFLSLFFVITGSLLVTSIFGLYNASETNPQLNEDFTNYFNPSVWLANHVDNVTVLSDANTMGYIAIWYGKYGLYEKTNIYFRSIGENSYSKLMNGTASAYKSSDTMFMYNYDLFDKHLLFESLQSWNKYEPLPPSIAIRNDLNVVYNSRIIWILN
ncbi:MAG: hypothetical protein H5T41_00645 [Methanomassiliicoccales archaeon]|nr:hypothetical protein [Methanomassiliicoccales archaeon]